MNKSMEFYKAVGGGKLVQYSLASFLASLVNPWSTVYKNVKKSKKYNQKTNLVGEGLITGGMYVVHKGGKPEYSYSEKVIGDHADMKAAMSACRVVAGAGDDDDDDAGGAKSGL